MISETKMTNWWTSCFHLCGAADALRISCHVSCTGFCLLHAFRQFISAQSLLNYQHGAAGASGPKRRRHITKLQSSNLKCSNVPKRPNWRQSKIECLTISDYCQWKPTLDKDCMSSAMLIFLLIIWFDA